MKEQSVKNAVISLLSCKVSELIVGATLMHNAEAVVSEIARRIRQLPDPTTQPVRAVRREFSRQLANAEPQVVIEIGLKLLARREFLHRFIAYELINHNPRALRSLRKKDLLQLADTLDSWVTVDTFGLFLAGPCWRERQVPDSLIESWTRSNDRWWRRTALVCTVALNNTARGGTGDTERTLSICRRLVSDREDMVVKALSWALRALAQRDPQAVRKFLNEHESMLAARVTREVRNKLTTGLKNPSQAAKKHKKHKSNKD